MCLEQNEISQMMRRFVYYCNKSGNFTNHFNKHNLNYLLHEAVILVVLKYIHFFKQIRLWTYFYLSFKPPFVRFARPRFRWLTKQTEYRFLS